MCEIKICVCLDVFEYVDVMLLYFKVWEILEDMYALTCTLTFREDFVALRWEFVICVDNVLIDLCGIFDVKKFVNFYDMYLKFGLEVKYLVDKI